MLGSTPKSPSFFWRMRYWLTTTLFDRSFDNTLAALEGPRISQIHAAVSSFTPDQDSGSHIDTLRAARSAGRLCLALGAGISVPYRLPNWEELVIELHNEYLPAKDADYVRGLCHRFGV